MFNLLDLDNDVLNIIGDYVKKYNERRISDFSDAPKIVRRRLCSVFG
jgi:hypothetical protein